MCLTIVRIVARFESEEECVMLWSKRLNQYESYDESGRSDKTKSRIKKNENKIIVETKSSPAFLVCVFIVILIGFRKVMPFLNLGQARRD